MANKIFASCAEAVRDIPDGAVIAFGGFAGIGTAPNLLQALAEQGAKNLTCVLNTPRNSPNLPAEAPDIGLLCERGMVKKVICAFTAPTRASQVLSFSKYYEAGLVEAELTPQGTLAERLRAAGAGIPAFYTPTAVGTELAEGRETRTFDGREYLLERALPVDYAFIRATRADAFGNLQYAGSQRNFCPVMAMAARVTVVEVEEEIRPIGAFAPDQVHTSGVFVKRMVRIPAAPAAFWPIPMKGAEA
jgi:3-oxoacid CoA-transferase A subunit